MFAAAMSMLGVVLNAAILGVLVGPVLSKLKSKVNIPTQEMINLNQL